MKWTDLTRSLNGRRVCEGLKKIVETDELRVQFSFYLGLRQVAFQGYKDQQGQLRRSPRLKLRMAVACFASSNLIETMLTDFTTC